MIERHIVAIDNDTIFVVFHICSHLAINISEVLVMFDLNFQVVGNLHVVRVFGEFGIAGF